MVNNKIDIQIVGRCFSCEKRNTENCNFPKIAKNTPSHGCGKWYTKGTEELRNKLFADTIPLIETEK